jgi:hypothetical protein
MTTHNQHTLSFPALLHDLIGLAGGPINVTVSDPDGHPAMAATGLMSGAVDVLQADADRHEVLFFPLDDNGDCGVLIAQAAFTGATWHDRVLHVELGALTLMIEPT